MGGETIVSKVQGEQNKSPGGQSTPWLPLRSAYAHRTPIGPMLLYYGCLVGS